MHILIAPNAFKNSLSATCVADAILEGISQSKLQFDGECFPIGDGGDGTGDLIIKKLKGAIVTAEVHDPLGRIIKSSFGLIEGGKTAVIEMADASGLRLLTNNELDPLHATTYGTGELMKRALDKGVKRIIIGMGGSATVDAGSGIVNALGIRFLNSDGKDISGPPRDLISVDTIDISGLDQRILDCEVIVLCDVDNKLLGSHGAAAVFGPQKGATSKDVEQLEKALEKIAKVTLQQTGKDMSAIQYGGTAGGAAAGLFAFLNAKLVNGIDHFLQLTDFEAALQRSDLLITGEGSIDEQTLNGKGPFGVAHKAKLKGIPVIGLAGKVPLDKSVRLQQYFDMLLSIGHEPCELTSALQYTRNNLVRTSQEIGNLLALCLILQC
jgi:glycerate 2-kinase